MVNFFLKETNSIPAVCYHKKIQPQQRVVLTKALNASKPLMAKLSA
jgi:hypothetical protein